MKYKYSRKLIFKVITGKAFLPEFKTTHGVRTSDLKAILLATSEEECKCSCHFQSSSMGCEYCSDKHTKPKEKIEPIEKITLPVFNSADPDEYPRWIKAVTDLINKHELEIKELKK